MTAGLCLTSSPGGSRGGGKFKALPFPSPHWALREFGCRLVRQQSLNGARGEGAVQGAPHPQEGVETDGQPVSEQLLHHGLRPAGSRPRVRDGAAGPCPWAQAAPEATQSLSTCHPLCRSPSLPVASVLAQLRPHPPPGCSWPRPSQDGAKGEGDGEPPSLLPGPRSGQSQPSKHELGVLVHVMGG